MVSSSRISARSTEFPGVHSPALIFYVVITDEVALGRDGTKSIVCFFWSVGGFHNTLGPSEKTGVGEKYFPKEGITF
jgi:hypothetical protein